MNLAAAAAAEEWNRAREQRSLCQPPVMMMTNDLLPHYMHAISIVPSAQ
jgi:hypothetical protein